MRSPCWRRSCTRSSAPGRPCAAPERETRRGRRACLLDAEAVLCPIAPGISCPSQNTVEPTEEQLAMIAEFQRTDKRFFSSEELQDFASSGPAPVLPPGKTAGREKRGCLMFVETEFTPGSTKGICAQCHTGPMLNQTSPFNTRCAARCAHRQHRRQRAESPELARIHILIDDGSGDVQAVRMSDLGIPLTNPATSRRATAVCSAPGVVRRLLQDSLALGREEDCSLLP